MSWEADKQLVRTTQDGVHNLAVGEPKFLRELFKPYYPKNFPFNHDLLAYPDIKPIDGLEEQLREISGGKYIVVTNGAKQALYAAIDAYKGLTEAELEVIGVSWPSYKGIAAKSGYKFNRYASNAAALILNNTPNNPDGKERSYTCDIWDAVYHHSVYGANLNRPPAHTISVWSAGKLLGSPGTRLGWLATNNGEMAQKAAQYVEQTTSGVSVVSQFHVNQTLYNTQNIRKDLFVEGREVLEVHYKLVRQHLSEFVTVPTWDFYPKKVGMFAYVHSKDPEKFKLALQKANVLLVSGESCGDHTPGNYRMSLGLTTSEMKAALEALNKAYKEI